MSRPPNQPKHNEKQPGETTKGPRIVLRLRPPVQVTYTPEGNRILHIPLSLSAIAEILTRTPRRAQPRLPKARPPAGPTSNPTLGRVEELLAILQEDVREMRSQLDVRRRMGLGAFYPLAEFAAVEDLVRAVTAESFSLRVAETLRARGIDPRAPSFVGMATSTTSTGYPEDDRQTAGVDPYSDSESSIGDDEASDVTDSDVDSSDTDM
ncbi:uncharacterized protein BXZ73DRAFT_75948 [Epithele typhae]|uniref:uncharacterized protein n=1 Tax=Epithele typhae TaxID=378194 RepID=UPI00200811D9|nr:uncharacterized protein BXZ73DRAFT_75948 [Epithele typhae]KAH9939780.1 hypothetical protein BXZ73DRAFT_75948 [Epithele typhae]